MSDGLTINTGSANSADHVKKYKEKYNALMQGVGSFQQTVGNIFNNAASGNIDLSGVSVFNDNGQCAING